MVEPAKTLVILRPQDAVTLCKQAIQRDPSRYEAHVVAAAALRQQKLYARASAHLQTALALAPEDQTPSIRRALTETKVAVLSADSSRKLDGLKLILDDAGRTKSRDDRETFLREFLSKSDVFLKDYPLISDLWLIRAQIAVEMDEPNLGWRAGRKLIELGDNLSDDPAARKLLATLERKGWLDQKPPDVIPTLTAAFTAKLQVIGVQRFHGVSQTHTETDTTDSLDHLSGSCQAGLEITETLAVIQKREDRSSSNFTHQPFTLWPNNDHFNAVVQR
jgi:hypothetical protein